MTVSIAEYLGQRVDINEPLIEPAARNDMCPFMDAPCKKLVPEKLQKPICSVRKDGELWIVCEHRLCATKKTKKVPAPTPRNPNRSRRISIDLTDYQKDRLFEIARMVYDADINRHEVLVKREINVPVGNDAGNYRADYVMRRAGMAGGEVLEIQGGGETSNTGKITRHVDEWEANQNRTNTQLTQNIPGVGTIETNAWRRQQEQFLIKGNVATKSSANGRIIFCVGSLLYDYLILRIGPTALGEDLRNAGWDLALIAFKEDTTLPICSGPIPLVIDEQKMFFTRYNSFVRALADQGESMPGLFDDDFEALEC